jgi:hypothetical protein
LQAITSLSSSQPALIIVWHHRAIYSISAIFFIGSVVVPAVVPTTWNLKNVIVIGEHHVHALTELLLNEFAAQVLLLFLRRADL